MDQFTRSSSFVALGRFETDPSELAHPDPGQNRRDGRGGHAEHLGDLRTGEPQPPQRDNRLNAPLAGAIRDAVWRRGAIVQPELALTR